MLVPDTGATPPASEDSQGILMKCYRVTLSIGLHTWVVADDVKTQGGSTHFLLRKSVIASYPTKSILRMMEMELPPRLKKGQAEEDAPPS